MIFLLELVTVIILIITYYGVGKDIMHPGVLVLGSSVLSILAAIYNIELWDIHYHWNSFIALTFSFVCISISSIFFTRIKMKRKRFSLAGKDSNIVGYAIVINNSVFLLIVLYSVFVFLWYFIIIQRAVGSSQLTKMISEFRRINAYGSYDNFRIPFILNQCIKLNKSIAYVFLILFFNNLYLGHRHIKYLVPPLFYMLQTIIGSDRIYIFELIVSSFVASYIMWHRKVGWNKTINSKYLNLGLKIGATLLIFFYFANNIVGHGSGDTNIIKYITQYAGGSIQNFNLYMQDPRKPQDTKWGEEIFYSVHKTLLQLQGITPEKIHQEFRYSNGVSVGNIYSAVRRYHYDFGMVGVIVFSFLFGSIFTILYRVIQQERVKTLASFALCVYATMIHAAYFFPLGDYFYATNISVAFLSSTLIMWVFYTILMKFSMKLPPSQSTHNDISEKKVHTSLIKLRIIDR